MTSPACFARSTRACASSSAEPLANRPSPSRQETDRPAPPDGERGMTIGAAWTCARAGLSPYRAQLRFCLRMTAAALLAFALAQIWNIPLNGLWAVLTAVVGTQMSVGGSLHATTEYLLGTIGGAIYAATIGVLIPHPTTLGLAGVLALTIAPLAFAAAVNPSFRSAPFTGAIVLLIAGQVGEGPIRIGALPVARGGTWRRGCRVVSLLVLPQRAYGLGLDAAARLLDLLAQLFSSCWQDLRKGSMSRERHACSKRPGALLLPSRRLRSRPRASGRSILWRSRIPLRWRGPCSGCATTSSSSGERLRSRSRKNSPSVSVRRSRAWPNARANICMKAQARFVLADPRRRSSRWRRRLPPTTWRSRPSAARG